VGQLKAEGLVNELKHVHVNIENKVAKLVIDHPPANALSGAVLASQQGRRSNVDEVGAGLLAFGLLSKVVSAATTPAADTRTWDNLPQYLSFAALRLPAGEHAATVEFQDAAGRPISSLTRSITIQVPATDRDTVVFISDKK